MGKLTDHQVRELIADYRNGASSPQLAARYGVSPEAVCYRLRQARIVPRHRGKHQPNTCPVSTEQLATMYHRDGLSSTQIAERLGRPSGSVRGWLDQFGITKRSSHQTQRLMTARGEMQRHKFTAEEVAAAAERLRQWNQSDRAQQIRPEAGRKGGRLRWWKQRPQWVNCHWCGEPVRRHQSELKRTTASFCNCSCASFHKNWKRWRAGQPRPLILERLRNGESGIGESRIELDELTLERMLAAREAGPTGEGVRGNGNGNGRGH